MLKETNVVELLARVGLPTALLTIALAGCTVVALDASGLFPELEKPRGWIGAAAVVAGWGFLLLNGRDLGAGFLEWRRTNKQSRLDAQSMKALEAEILGRIDILEPSERRLLAYYKHQGARQFRAYRNAKEVWALTNMGLIKRHEATGDDECRYSIPQAVFDAIYVTPQQIEMLDKMKTLPWERPQ
jgi:hypothetical protein